MPASRSAKYYIQGRFDRERKIERKYREKENYGSHGDEESRDLMQRHRILRMNQH